MLRAEALEPGDGRRRSGVVRMETGQRGRDVLDVRTLDRPAGMDQSPAAAQRRQLDRLLVAPDERVPAAADAEHGEPFPVADDRRRRLALAIDPGHLAQPKHAATPGQVAEQERAAALVVRQHAGGRCAGGHHHDRVRRIAGDLLLHPGAQFGRVLARETGGAQVVGQPLRVADVDAVVAGIEVDDLLLPGDPRARRRPGASRRAGRGPLGRRPLGNETELLQRRLLPPPRRPAIPVGLPQRHVVDLHAPVTFERDGHRPRALHVQQQAVLLPLFGKRHRPPVHAGGQGEIAVAACPGGQLVQPGSDLPDGLADQRAGIAARASALDALVAGAFVPGAGDDAHLAGRVLGKGPAPGWAVGRGHGARLQGLKPRIGQQFLARLCRRNRREQRQEQGRGSRARGRAL